MKNRIKNIVKNVAALGLITCASIFSINANAAFVNFNGSTFLLESIVSGAVTGTPVEHTVSPDPYTFGGTAGPEITITGGTNILVDFSGFVAGRGGSFTYNLSGATDLGFRFRDFLGDIDAMSLGNITTNNVLKSGVSFLPTDITIDPDGNSIFVNMLGFTVSTNSTMSFDVNFTPAPVPVPAAVWLFGSGLIGLAGVARRKKNSINEN